MGTGANIKKILDNRGMTIRELSNRTGIPYTTIRSILSRDSEPKLSVLEKIAEALDTSTFRLSGIGFDFCITDRIGHPQNKLSSEEVQILDLMQNLNQEGKQKALERVEELTEIPRYSIVDMFSIDHEKLYAAIRDAASAAPAPAPTETEKEPPSE